MTCSVSPLPENCKAESIFMFFLQDKINETPSVYVKFFVLSIYCSSENLTCNLKWVTIQKRLSERKAQCMMKEYIEKILHQDVQISPYADLNRLPLSYKTGYDLKLMTVGEQNALLAAPMEKTPLAVLRKQQHQMTIYTGLPCVLYMTDMNYYTKRVKKQGEALGLLPARQTVICPSISALRSTENTCQPSFFIIPSNDDY